MYKILLLILLVIIHNNNQRTHTYLELFEFQEEFIDLYD